MKHIPSLGSNTTCCKVGRECRTCPLGNAGPAPIRVPSLHFLYIVFFTVYNVLSSALLLEFVKIN